MVEVHVEDRRHWNTFTAFFASCSSPSLNIFVPFFSIFSSYIFSFVYFKAMRCDATSRCAVFENWCFGSQSPPFSLCIFRRCAMLVDNNITKQDLLLWIGKGDKDIMKKEFLSVLLCLWTQSFILCLQCDQGESYFQEQREKHGPATALLQGKKHCRLVLK